MAARVPVIASRAAGVDPEVLRDGETARFVGVGSTEDFAQAVIDLAGDAGLRRRLAEGGYSVYERLGSASAEFDRAEQTYRDLVARRGL
jgi:glycosyltransferase involved in cell wall biosynthesis